MMALLFVAVSLVAFAATASEPRLASLANRECAFIANGGDPGPKLFVELTDENLQRLNKSLASVAYRLGMLEESNVSFSYDLFNPVTGQPISDLADCVLDPSTKSTLALVRKGDLFVYPPYRIGYERTIGNVTMKTLSVRPKVFEVRNILTDSECEHIRRRSKLDGKADGTAFLRAREDSVLDEITTRIAALLHLPAQLADMNDGYTVHVKVPRKASSGPVTPERDFIHRGDKPLYEGFHRGINQFVTLALFLNDVANGGGISFPLSNVPNAVQYISEGSSGHLQMFLPPGVFACEGSNMGPAIEGSLVFMYNLDAGRHGFGEPDLTAFYQLCNPVSTTQWSAKMRIANKIIYDTKGLFLLEWIDTAMASVLGVSLTSVLTNGYGWDWSEDVLEDNSDYRHQVAEEIAQPLKNSH